ncbi:MerR family transcriptional regulator [Tsukamurella sp. 8F]|uniref:MerR family transcriptional regulator n=1 Tax=unclassified Tsukamurella TaxID=2633480 RepID=UPI0023B8BDD8|nr:MULTISPECIES: MerR family transcriptional regulator [unclassified Tsukamurella]MDF0532435.1 MerR family transcriptional regulator [Tsukamurella sp. 8J]MDF0585201.1 MerR family transcriptional regulator [Tsukamurella sp. 8F]
MTDRDELFSIGDLAGRTGVSVKTVRFWADEGLVPVRERTAGGYRLFDAEAAARLDLVRTLRELGIGLPTVREVLARQETLADVAAAHALALDAEIRTLRTRRAVLRAVARSGSTTEELRIMNEMANVSAAERQRVIDEFVDEAFAGIPADAPGAHIANGMRSMPAELPDEPTTAQVEAWIELAALVADPGFRARCRQMAVEGARTEAPVMVDLEPAAAAEARGLAPDSAEAATILDGIVPAGTDRAALAEQMATFSDRRVERYWALLGLLNGWPPRESTFSVASAEWAIAALRAHSA